MTDRNQSIPETDQHIPRLEPVRDQLRVLVAGQEIARSRLGSRIIGIEPAPTYFIPPYDIDLSVLHASDRQGKADWCGRVAYFHLTSSRGLIPNLAWFLPDPPDQYLPIRRFIVFFPQLIDEAWVGQKKVLTGQKASCAGWAVD